MKTLLCCVVWCRPPGRGSEKSQRKAVSASATSHLSSHHSGSHIERSRAEGDDVASSQEGPEPPPPEAPLPFNATLEPLQVHVASQPARAPTLQECQVILQHMQQVNDRQSHEVSLHKISILPHMLDPLVGQTT